MKRGKGMAMKRLAVAFRVLTWLATASLMGIALSSGEASASVAVVDFELLAPGGEFPPVPGGTRDTMGWSFEPNDELSLTHLGFFDAQGDGLDVSHRVGLWTADGDLLAEAYVPSGTDASLLDGYRYVEIGSLALHAGQTYIIGATAVWTESDQNGLRILDTYPTYNVEPASLAVDDNLTLTSYWRFVDEDGGLPPLPPGELHYPSTEFPDGYFLAPNFAFTVVPEAGTLVMVCTGATLMALKHRHNA
jgi:hypothetical protein